MKKFTDTQLEIIRRQVGRRYAVVSGDERPYAIAAFNTVREANQFTASYDKAYGKEFFGWHMVDCEAKS